MADPLTLSALGAVALTEGIKFLYEQAGEILKRWRERKDSASKEASPQVMKVEPAEAKLPSIFQGQLTPLQIHFDAVERLEEQIRGMRKDLSEYAEDIEPVDPHNAFLLQRTEALRQLLEAVYQQRLTFKGEQRPPSGPIVESSIDIEEIAGYAAAVRARQIKEGNVKVDAKVKHIQPGGSFTGIDADTIGG